MSLDTAPEPSDKDGRMRPPTLFNLDAFFELVIGLLLLFNPLLGPVLPLPGPVIVLAAVVLLVAACVLGRAGMGRGALVSRIRTLALVNVGSSAVLTTWAFVSCRAGGRVLVLITAAGLSILGAAQLAANERRGRSAATTRRATVEEMQQALRSK